MELTRREAHLNKPEGLDEELVSSTPKSENDLKKGESYDAMVVSCSAEKEEGINTKYSNPI